MSLRGQRHGLLFGQAELAVAVFHVAGGGVGAEPFTQQAGVAAGSLGELLGVIGWLSAIARYRPSSSPRMTLASIAAPPMSFTSLPMKSLSLASSIASSPRGLDDRIGAGNPRLGRRAHHPVHERRSSYLRHKAAV